MRIAKPVRELGTRAPWLHEGGVRAIEIARDGNILTIGNEGDIRKWMLATGEMAMRSERGPREGTTYDCWLLPEIERAVSFCVLEESSVFRTFDLRSGSYLGEVPLSDDFQDRSLQAIDREGRRALITNGEERAVPALVSIEDGTLLARLEGGHERAAFLSSGEIVTPDIGGEIRVWDSEGRQSRTLVPPQEPPPDASERGPQRVQSIHASRVHPLFAVVYDYRIAVFSNDGKKLFEVAEHYSPVVFSPSGERVAMSASGRIVLYDLEGREQGAVSTDAIPLDYVTIGLDHRVIVGAQSSGELHARSTSTALPSPGAGAERKATVLPGEIASISAVRDGSGAVAFSCASGDVLLWKPGQPIPARLPGTGRSSGQVRCLPDGRMIVISYYFLRVISPETHRVHAEYPIPGEMLSPDSRLAANLAAGGRFTLFETETGALRSDVILEGTETPPLVYGFQFNSESSALSDDGSVVQIVRNEVRVWRADGSLRAKTSLDRFVPELPESVHAYWRVPMFVAPDELVVGDTISGLHRFHVDRDEWETLTSDKGVTPIALDPARRRIATYRTLPDLGEWGTSVFDLDSRSWLLDIPSGGRYLRAEFLPDGSLVTSTPDRRLVVWEAP